MSSGHLRKHEQFRSRFLRNQRDLIVYTPPGYAGQSRRRFPVLYLHDGQNLFDGATSFIPGQDWHVGQTADHCIRIGSVAPLIIVGMYNTKARIREYTPTHVPKLGGGRADRYAKFLIEEVKPFSSPSISASSIRAFLEKSSRFHRPSGGTSTLYIASLEQQPSSLVRASGSTSAPAKALASCKRSKNSATCSSKRAGSWSATCTSNASKARSTTKQPGRSASARSCNFCILRAKPLYNPRSIHFVARERRMPQDRPLTILCVSSYEKGQEFIRTCKAMGCLVLLLTVEKLRHADWPFECIRREFCRQVPFHRSHRRSR